ncbi:MAG TPA: carboxypeptidase regulatory-like domain-containing protein [Chloroflexi bacterium]|nr:carboxypeptidase regulatory-like domain-containing protein [Chloroflexota bacterium]
MELNDYPRPANDTGIGVHWTVGYAAAVGMAKIREFWLPELKAMGVKWVKIFNHDGALDFCELLLAEGFMPIVRLYRPAPNPGRLGVKELVHLDALIRIGVRYFEFNNEPDVDAEWKGGRVPVNGLELTVENTIAALEVILERGGMPAIPAVSNGSRWDLVGRIVAAGRRDLFDGPVWQAIHNYSQNRPLDYPYDVGNQEGGAFTERFYRAVASENWQADAWRGRTLAEVNRLRYDRRNPGATIADDHACWLAYEHFDALNRKHLGRSIPILSTECGYIVGEDTDPRYPATTPDLHMAQTLEACRIMMGTSQRFKHAPDYYFCTAFWLLANERLGSTSSWWEGHAWYSDRWPGGALPVTRALQAEPKTPRLGVEPPPRITLRGSVANLGAQRTLILARDGVEVAQQTLDNTGIFEFTDLADGEYVLRLPEANYSESVTLHRDQREVVVRLTLPAPVELVGRSAVEGYVAGGAGAVVMLVHTDSGEEWVTLARDDGSYRFVDLPAGEYSLRVHPAGSHIEHLRLDGRSKVNVDLVQAGWGYTIGVAAATPGIGAVVVSVPGHKGLKVQVHGAEGASQVVETGSAPEYGAAACQIGGLDEGHYIVTVDHAPEADGRTTQLEARVHIDKRVIPLVEFVYGVLDTPAVPMADSAITGKVRGVRIGQPLRVALLDDRAGRQEQFVSSSGEYAFEALAAGLYTVQIVGYEAAASVADIALDGRNRVTVDLALPEEVRYTIRSSGEQGLGVITAVVPEGAGRTARLVDAVGNERREIVNDDGEVRFDGLAAGVYSLFVEGGFAQSNLELADDGGWRIIFAPLISVWEATVTQAGPMPGFSAIHVEIEGLPNHPVRVYQGEEQEFTLSTRSRAEQGAYAVEFKPLGPGVYRVEPDGLGVWATVELTGLEAVRVGFRRVQEPVGANRVEPILPAAQRSTASAPNYLYIAAPPTSLEQCLALLRLAAAEQPQVGADLTAAAHAARVFIAPSPDAEAIAQHLRHMGVAVEMIADE